MSADTATAPPRLLTAASVLYRAAQEYQAAANNPPLDGPAAERETRELIDAAHGVLCALPWAAWEAVWLRLAEDATGRVGLPAEAVIVTDDDGYAD